jgi:hypothetical protein
MLCLWLYCISITKKRYVYHSDLLRHVWLYYTLSNDFVLFIFTESGIPYEVVASIDINTTANKIYRHNFIGTYLMESGIEVNLWNHTYF